MWEENVLRNMITTNGNAVNGTRLVKRFLDCVSLLTYKTSAGLSERTQIFHELCKRLQRRENQSKRSLATFKKKLNNKRDTRFLVLCQAKEQS